MIEKKDTTQPWTIYQKYFDLLGNQPHIPLSDLHKITAPALILAGDKDVITVGHTDQIFENIPHAHLCIFPGATHMIPIQDPVLFNSTLEKFFSTPYQRPDTKEIIESMQF